MAKEGGYGMSLSVFQLPADDLAFPKMGRRFKCLPVHIPPLLGEGLGAVIQTFHRIPDFPEGASRFDHHQHSL